MKQAQSRFKTTSLSANDVLDTPIKAKVYLDAGANGQNAAQPDFPFSYASINDAISMMTHGCYMAKLDRIGIVYSQVLPVLVQMYP